MEYWRLDEEWLEEELRPPGRRRRRTFAGLALAFVAGVAWGLTAAVPAGWAVAAGAGLAVLSLMTYERRWTTLLLAGAMVLLGAADARMVVFGGGPSSLGRLLSKRSEYVRMRVLATEDAVLRPAGVSRREAYVFRGRLEEVNRTGEWLACGDDIRVVLQGPAEAGVPAPRYGDLWEMSGIAEAGHVVSRGFFRLPRNEAVVGADRARRVAQGGGNAFFRWCAARRRACRRVLSLGVEEQQPGAGMVQALVLGYRQDIPEPLREDFSATGSIHIFAISGAHVGIICSFVLMLLRVFCVPADRRFWWVAPVLAVYVAMTGASASAVRAAIMLGCLHAAPAMRRRADPPTALALAAFLILVVSPGDLADLGFVLSFAAVWGILALQPVFARLVRGVLRRDPWRTAQRRSDKEDAPPLWTMALDSFVLGLAVWVATAPLTMHFFNLVSPVAPLMNLLVIPAAYCILLGGVLALLASIVTPVLAVPFAQASTTIANLLAKVVEWSSQIPGGHFYAASPGLWFLGGWLATLIAGCAAFRRHPRGATAGTLGVLAALAVGYAAATAREDRLYVLDAAPGQAVVYKQGAHVVMIDTGPAFRAPVVLRQLREIGANRIDTLVLSHLDAEHIGAVPMVLDALPVGEVWLPRKLWNCAATAQWLRLLEARTDIPPPVRYQAGDCLPMPGDTTAEVLWPPADIRLRNSDDAALLLRITAHGRSVLVTTDFGGDLERQYLGLHESNPDLFPWPAADVLLLGRGSAADASSVDWLRAVSPKEAIALQSNSIKVRTPEPALLDRLRELGIPVRAPGFREPLVVDMR